MGLKDILLVGAGGHAKACIDVIEAERRFRIQGLVGTLTETKGTRLGYPVLATDADLPALYQPGANALVCVGQIKTSEPRARLFSMLCELGYALPVVISPTAWVSPHARIGAGSIIMHGAVVNAGAVVGKNCIINTLSLVEHEALVGDHCHIATGARLNSGVHIGEGTFIGSGTMIRQGVTVGRNCIVGMGLSVLANCPDNAWLPKKRNSV